MLLPHRAAAPRVITVGVRLFTITAEKKKHLFFLKCGVYTKTGNEGERSGSSKKGRDVSNCLTVARWSDVSLKTVKRLHIT